MCDHKECNEPQDHEKVKRASEELTRKVMKFAFGSNDLNDGEKIKVIGVTMMHLLRLMTEAPIDQKVFRAGVMEVIGAVKVPSGVTANATSEVLH